MNIHRVVLASILYLSMVTAPSIGLGQQLSSGQVQEAKSRLGTMSPEEIDQKIKSLGMTREEAEKRAAENGIDLQSYLQGGSSAGSSSGSSQPSLMQSGPSGGSAVEAAVSAPRTVKQSFPTSRGLSHFGYNIFATTPASFEPSAVGPIDPEYTIGPEDVLRVSVWGQVEQQNELVVDKEGRIFIPSAGPVVVSGLTVDEVNKTLTKQLSRSIQGLTSTPKTVWMDVTLAKVRPKRIFIMGEVNNPGGYTVSSYSTVFNSLFAVGGPTVNGSLREVRLIRENKVVAKIDLYLYLTGSDKNNDVRVQNNDIIFIPVRKNSIFLQGEVRRPAIYELLPGENLKKLIEYAGGTLPSTYLERLQIERIIPAKERVKKDFERVFKDINFRDVIAKNTDVPLVDGDMITAYSVLDEVKNFVKISGAVYKPGTYQLTPKMKLLDLIELADSLKPESYTVRGELTRWEKDNTTKLSIPFDLKTVMENDAVSNILLQPKDEILIHNIGITREAKEFVEIYGSVKNPGQYSLTKNMTLTDVLMLAEGYSENAWTYQAEIARLDRKKEADTLVYIYFSNLPDLRDTVSVKDFNFFSESRSSDLQMKHRDKIFIRPDPNFRPQQLVTIEGEVNFPGAYALITHNEYLSELFKRAGGKTNAAYLRGGRLIRGGERVIIDFQKAIDDPKGTEDIILHEGDKMEIPKKPNSVKVYGEVINPGVFGYVKGNDLWDYIDNSGGLRDSAEFVVLFHPNGFAERFNTGIFGGNSDIYDGSAIYVTKMPPPPPDKKDVDLGNLIRDMFAIAASALTILVLARQI